MTTEVCKLRAAQKTKACLHPWKTTSILGNGAISPCCGNVTGHWGNLNDDLFQKREGEETDIFRNADYLKLREGLLSGNIPDSCKDCRIIAEDDISTDELKKRLMVHIATGSEDVDLLREFRITELVIGITNKCNLRCIYCPQSIPKSRTGGREDLSSMQFYQAEISEKNFFRLLDYLAPRGLKYLNFVGLGELTIYKNWQHLLDQVHERYPDLHAQVVTNLSVELRPEDIHALLKFDAVVVSCDTLDKDLHESIRAGSNFEIFYANLMALLQTRNNVGKHCAIGFNITESNLTIRTWENLFRFATLHDIGIGFSGLYYVKDSVADRTNHLKKINEMDHAELLEIWPMINSLPRRIKAENPRIDADSIGPFYKYIKTIAMGRTCDLFYPTDSPDDTVYRAFKKLYLSDGNHYLRNIYLSFDECIKGICLKKGNKIRFPLDVRGTYEFNVVGVIERPDRNLEISIAGTVLLDVTGEITLNATSSDFEEFSHVLFSITLAAKSCAKITSPDHPLQFGNRIFVRELLLLHEIDEFISNLAVRGIPCVIWCAGARTQRLFDWTSLGSLSIIKIVDSNPDLQGTHIGTHIVATPDEVRSIAAPVLIVNATNPYKIEQEIKLSDYKFTDYFIL